ncbi:MAG: hypothetical protein LBH93_02885 [Chitinispirillales bacterium]|jgi:hypothetical protein|nr:hypothetical protein [Chitinispirillales bacterium]
MAAAAVDVGNAFEIRMAGLQALNRALGEEGAKAFLTQWSNAGSDFLKGREELNATLTNKEVMEGILALQAKGGASATPAVEASPNLA